MEDGKPPGENDFNWVELIPSLLEILFGILGELP